MRRATLLGAVLMLVLVSSTGALLDVPGLVARAPFSAATSPDAPLRSEVVPATDPATLVVQAGHHVAVPILYYHYIRVVVPSPQDLLSFDLSISPALFARQMALLRVDGAHTITLATLAGALAGRAPLPANPVVLTFDDGYADFATAAEPVLQRFGLVATDFVVSGFVDRPRYMTTAQVRQMEANGMVIGAHTVHHVNLASLTFTAARAEIDNGKAALEAILGHAVLDFAYPFGGFNPMVEQLVRRAGFRDAVSTIGGDVQSLSVVLALRRTEIGGAPSLADFARDAGMPPPTAVQETQVTVLAQAPVLHAV